MVITLIYSCLRVIFVDCLLSYCDFWVFYWVWSVIVDVVSLQFSGFHLPCVPFYLRLADVLRGVYSSLLCASFVLPLLL